MPRAQTRIGPLDELIGYHLRRSSAAFHADFNKAVEGTGLRQVLFGILSVISINPGVNQSKVGKLLGIKRANMVSLINELIELGLIERADDPDDRRALTLTLTRSGSDVFAAGLKRIRDHEQEMLADLSQGETQLLLELLRRIHARAPAAD